MPTRRRHRFINAQIAWMLSVLLFLTALDALTVDLFFILAFVGFLIVVELTDPFTIVPRWRRRLKWIIVAGMVGFVVVVIRQILRILPEGAI